MYTRVVDCTLRSDKRESFNLVLRDQVLPLLRQQPGFVALIGLLSDDQAERALAVTFWQTKDDAVRFYRGAAPMRDYLEPLTAQPPKVEHFDLDTSIFQFTAASKAA